MCDPAPAAPILKTSKLGSRTGDQLSCWRSGREGVWLVTVANRPPGLQIARFIFVYNGCWRHDVGLVRMLAGGGGDSSCSAVQLLHAGSGTCCFHAASHHISSRGPEPAQRRRLVPRERGSKRAAENEAIRTLFEHCCSGCSLVVGLSVAAALYAMPGGGPALRGRLAASRASRVSRALPAAHTHSDAHEILMWRAWPLFMEANMISRRAYRRSLAVVSQALKRRAWY